MKYEILKEIREMEGVRRSILIQIRGSGDITIRERCYLEWKCFHLRLIILRLKYMLRKEDIQ